MEERIFIIDYDLVSPLGLGREEVFNALRNNVCAEGKIQSFDTSGIPLFNAAEVLSDLSGLYRNEHPVVKSAIAYNRKFELLVSVFNLMKDRLEYCFGLADVEKKGVILGLGAEVPSYDSVKEEFQPNASAYDPYFESVFQKSQKTGNALFHPYDLSAVYLAEQLQLGAFQQTSLTACAASTQSVTLACDAIRNGEAEIVLAGGTDSIINDLALSSFNKLGVLAPTSADDRSCKPFDTERNGTTAGEAAGLCVIASESFVRKNRLTPLFEILSYGNSLDAYQITSPDPEGKGVKRALREALEYSGIQDSEIGYINLHGTGTRQNDIMELQSLKDVFGEALSGIPVSSTKDRHGHAIASAGIQELSVLCIALENNLLPCNLNVKNPIPMEGIDLIMGENRQVETEIGMSCNYSFGGVNTVLIIRKIKK